MSNAEIRYIVLTDDTLIDVLSVAFRRKDELDKAWRLCDDLPWQDDDQWERVVDQLIVNGVLYGCPFNTCDRLDTEFFQCRHHDDEHEDGGSNE